MKVDWGGVQLHLRNPRLHESPDVRHVVSYLRHCGVRIPNTPSAKLNAFMRFLAADVGNGVVSVNRSDRKRLIEAHVIPADAVPDQHFPAQRGRVVQIGVPRVPACEDVRAQMVEMIREDQRAGLTLWLDYLTEGGDYPSWFRYYVWESVTRLGPYSALHGGFQRRSRGTAARFPDLNPEALGQVFNTLNREESLNESFATLYAEALQRCGSMSPEERARTDGAWVRYEQTELRERGVQLAQSLQPYGTGWCTAGEATAQFQLSKGDFHIYCSRDLNGRAVVPRIAIRMEAGEVFEVRGVDPHQEMEPSMLEIVEKKLGELPGGEWHRCMAQDMRRIMRVDAATEHHPSCALSTEDLRLLYRLDRFVDGFGFGRNPRFDAIQARRDMKADLALVFGTSRERISTTHGEALSGGIVYHVGTLHLDGITSIEELDLPERVSDGLYMEDLTSAKGLRFPSVVRDVLDLRGLTTVDGLRLPDEVGTLILCGLTSARGLQLPDHMEGGLDLSGVTSTQDLRLPSYIGDMLDLSSLTSAEGLKLPLHVGGVLSLRGLTSASGLQFPSHIGDVLDLSGLITTDGLELPEHLDRGLDLSGLKTLGGLRLPSRVGQLFLDLSSLTSAEGLHLPDHVGDLYLGSLTSARGLQLPKRVDDLDLRGLESAAGLQLPLRVGGEFRLDGLKSAKGLQLPRYVGDDLNLSGLTSADGLVLPEHIGGELIVNDKVRVQLAQRKRPALALAG
jgi:hypothetical protein